MPSQAVVQLRFVAAGLRLHRRDELGNYNAIKTISGRSAAQS